MSEKIAIIVLVYNGRQYLPDCLSSLRQVSYKDHEVVVIDNNSDDDSVKYVKENYPNFTLIVNKENLGFAGGNNVGIEYCLSKNFDYLYFLNQDTQVKPDFLESAVELAGKDKNIAAVQSKLLYHKNQKKINSSGNIIHYLGFGYAEGNLEDDNLKNNREITYASGACSLWRISALREIGMFDEKLFAYHEDLDLGWRARLLGYKIMLAANSVVFHKYEFSRSIKKYYYMERNRYIVMLQNYKWPTLFLIGPAMDVMEIGLFLFSLQSGWFKEKIRVYKYLFNGKNLEEIFKTREKVQKQRKVKDKVIIKHFTGVIKNQEIQNPILNFIVNPLFDLYWQIAKRIIFW